MIGEGDYWMIYRLLAMNIDGTLLQSNSRLHKSVKEAVEYVQSKGVKVTLVTSRNFIFAKRIAKALKLNSPIIAHHGAFIGTSVEKPNLVKRIDEEIVYDIVRFLESYSCHIRIVTETLSVSNVPLKKNMVSRAVIDTDSFSAYHHQFVQNLSSFIAVEEIRPTHLEVAFEDATAAEEAKVALQNMFFEVDLHLYHNQLIIVPNDVSKLTGLLYVTEQLKIPLKQTVVIGCDLDDVEMIDAAGLGVAMGHSPNEVKSTANWITRSNNEHGVAYMVKEHFRKQQPISFLEKLIA